MNGIRPAHSVALLMTSSADACGLVRSSAYTHIISNNDEYQPHTAAHLRARGPWQHPALPPTSAGCAAAAAAAGLQHQPQQHLQHWRPVQLQGWHPLWQRRPAALMPPLRTAPRRPARPPQAAAPAALTSRSARPLRRAAAANCAAGCGQDEAHVAMCHSADVRLNSSHPGETTRRSMKALRAETARFSPWHVHRVGWIRHPATAAPPRIAPHPA